MYNARTTTRIIKTTRDGNLGGWFVGSLLVSRGVLAVRDGIAPPEIGESHELSATTSAHGAIRIDVQSA